MRKRCCGCCRFAKLELDLENEIANRTCDVTGEYVPMDKSCPNWSERVLDYSNNDAIVDFYENKDASEIAHFF